jgi:lipid II:glycine glycyltransferase (peptidoglycan interpeptide bridge formation enzyme)
MSPTQTDLDTFEGTQIEAFNSILESGTDVTVRKEVAAHIGKDPKTLHELVDVTGRPKNSISPRLTELVRMGCVIKKGRRETPSGQTAYVHHLTDKGEKYLKGEVDPSKRKSVNQERKDLVEVARKYIHGKTNLDELEFRVEKFEEAKERADPEWEPEFN